MTKAPTTIAQPVPELPVADVAAAQRHYRDCLGFVVAWSTGDMGAVARGEVAVFLRKAAPGFTPAVHWVFAEQVDATFAELQGLGANIVSTIEDKPWKQRQFTVADLDGHLFHFHCDL